jgi:hypothetical protein
VRKVSEERTHLIARRSFSLGQQNRLTLTLLLPLCPQTSESFRLHPRYDYNWCTSSVGRMSRIGSCWEDLSWQICKQRCTSLPSYLRREVVLVNLFPLDKVIVPQGGGHFTPLCYDTLPKTDSRSDQASSYRDKHFAQRAHVSRCIGHPGQDINTYSSSLVS